MTARSVGSNPTPSATQGTRPGTGSQDEQLTAGHPLCRLSVSHSEIARRGGRAAEGNRLLSGWSGKTGPRVRIPASPPYALDASDEPGAADWLSPILGVEAGA